MADDNKLVVQIVLDDGSIVKGFAKIEEQAKKASEKASDSLSAIDTDFSVDGIVGKIKSINPNIAALASYATAAFAAIGLAFERSLAGEKLQALERQFQDLSKTAGVSAEEIESGFAKASRGTVDFSSNIEVINQAIIELGYNASKIPEIMAVAQKSALLTGKSVEESFKNILTAIESGNTKALKSSGIFLDQEAIFKKYAATLGLTANELNLMQRQQAVLNATLEQAATKFKDIDQNAKPMQTALERIKVAWNEIADASAKAANSTFGALFADQLERIAAAMGSSSSKTEILKRDIAGLELQLKGSELNDDQAYIQGLEIKLDKFKSQLAAINASEAAKSAALDDARKARGGTGGESAADVEARVAAFNKTNELDSAQLEAKRQRANEIKQMAVDVQQAELDAEIQKHALIRDINLQQDALIADSNAAKQIIEEQHQQNLLNIKQKYSSANGYSQAQTNAAIEAEDAKHKAKLSSNESKLFLQKQAIEKNKLAMTQTNLAAIAALMDSGSKELFEIGKVAGIANSTISTYEAINKTLAEGGMFAVPAAIAIGIMGFANVAKISSMQFGGGISAPSGGSLPSGGGINAGITTPIEAPGLANAPVEQAKPQAKIEVNIAGNILNNRETSLHLVELLNDAFEQHGAIVTGAV